MVKKVKEAIAILEEDIVHMNADFSGTVPTVNGIPSTEDIGELVNEGWVKNMSHLVTTYTELEKHYPDAETNRMEISGSTRFVTMKTKDYNTLLEILDELSTKR